MGPISPMGLMSLIRLIRLICPIMPLPDILFNQPLLFFTLHVFCSLIAAFRKINGYPQALCAIVSDRPTKVCRPLFIHCRGLIYYARTFGTNVKRSVGFIEYLHHIQDRSPRSSLHSGQVQGAEHADQEYSYKQTSGCV